MNAPNFDTLLDWCGISSSPFILRNGNSSAAWLRRIPEYLRNVCQELKLVMPELSDMTWSDAPYHNKHHCLLVTLLALTLAKYENGMTQTDLAVLLYAGLFHDAWHPGAGLPDTINVPLALRAFSVHCSSPRTVATMDFHRDVCAAIKWTKYPYADQEPDTAVARLLRDADILVMTYPARDYFIRGLSEELVALGPITEQTNAEFLSSCKLFTSQGHRLMEHYLRQVQVRGMANG